MKKELTDLFKNSEVSESQNFNSIKITLASPDKIKSWTYGEIKKPETINYRTFRPEKDGLFCARIFGPIKDYECLCGKYKRMKHLEVLSVKNVVLKLLFQKLEEREWAILNLASSCCSYLVFKIITYLELVLLQWTYEALKDLERVLYFENFIVIEPGLDNMDGAKEW